MIALIGSLVALCNDYLYMSNTNLVNELLRECTQLDNAVFAVTIGDDGTSPTKICQPTVSLVFELFFTLISKLILMILAFGIRIPGGIFIPSMVVGCLCGRITGILVQELNQLLNWNIQIIPGVYAMVGAAATIAGITRMTVSLAVILFELTGGLTYILPLMISIM